MTGSLSYEVHLNEPYEEALERVKEALKAESFGVLTEVDVLRTLKEKMDADFRPYAILGVCNPPLAHRALSHNAEVGLMLPCNVTVEEDPAGGVTVRIVNPVTMLAAMGMGEDPALKEVAGQAGEKLSRVAGSLAAASEAKIV